MTTSSPALTRSRIACRVAFMWPGKPMDGHVQARRQGWRKGHSRLTCRCGARFRLLTLPMARLLRPQCKRTHHEIRRRIGGMEPGYGVRHHPPAGGGEEVRVSQVAFPMDGDIPHLGEKLSFEIVTGRDGRKVAAQVRRLPRRSGTRPSSRCAKRAGVMPRPAGAGRASRARCGCWWGRCWCLACWAWPSGRPRTSKDLAGMSAAPTARR